LGLMMNTLLAEATALLLEKDRSLSVQSPQNYQPLNSLGSASH
jgi:hypothetical protein